MACGAAGDQGVGKGPKLLLVHGSRGCTMDVLMVRRFFFLGILVSISEASFAAKIGWKYHVLGVGLKNDIGDG